MKPKQQYRMLKAGEKIREGDEWYWHYYNEWLECIYIDGSMVRKMDVGYYRRPINKGKQ